MSAAARAAAASRRRREERAGRREAPRLAESSNKIRPTPPSVSNTFAPQNNAIEEKKYGRAAVAAIRARRREKQSSVKTDITDIPMLSESPRKTAPANGRKNSAGLVPSGLFKQREKSFSFTAKDGKALVKEENEIAAEEQRVPSFALPSKKDQPAQQPKPALKQPKNTFRRRVSFTDVEGASPLEDVLGHAYSKSEYDRSSIDVQGIGWTRPTTETSHIEEQEELAQNTRLAEMPTRVQEDSSDCEW